MHRRSIIQSKEQLDLNRIKPRVTVMVALGGVYSIWKYGKQVFAFSLSQL